MQTTMPWGILVMPPWLVQGLGLAAPLALAATAAVLRRRGRLTLLGTSFGALLALLAIALAGAAGYGLWSATAAASPDILSRTMKEPVVALPFLGAELLAGATVMAAAWLLGRLLVGRDALLAGTGMLALLLIAVVAVLSPAFASSMVLPAAAAGIGILLGTLLPPVPSLVARATALLPTGWLVGTQVHALGEFGIASSAGALAATTALALAAAAPLLIAPQGEASGAARRPHRLLIPVLPAVLAVGLVIGGTALTRAAGEPVQERVLAAVDAETGQTRWESDGVTEWGRSLDGTEGTSVVEGPQVEVEPAGEGTTSTRIRLTSARPGAEFRLELAEGEFSGVTVDGGPLSDDGSAGAQGLHALRILGVPAGHEVVIEAEVPAGASMELIEAVYSPALADGWVAPGPGVSLVQPRVEISRTVTL